MNPKKLVTAMALLAALAVGVSGCAGTTGQAVAGSTAGADAPTESAPAESAESAPADAPTDTATPSGEGESATAGEATAAGSYVDFSEDVLAQAAGTKVLFFHASWCPKCRALEKDILSSTIPAGLTIIKVDYDNSTALRQKYGVTLQTTVVYVDDDGSELSKKVLADDPSLDALVAAAP